MNAVAVVLLPPIHAASGAVDASLVPRLLVVVLAGLAGIGVGAALGALRDGRDILWIAAAAVLSRFALPSAFLQVDADDVRIAAIVRGVDLGGVHGTANPPPELVWLLRAPLFLFGDALDNVFLVPRAAGVLLPILGFLVARHWFASSRTAAWVGAILVGAPIVAGFSASVTAEIPAAALYALALLLALLAIEGPAWRVVAVVPSGLALALACSLKEELIALVLAFVVTIAARTPAAGRALASSFPPILAILFHSAAGSTDVGSLAGWRWHVLSVGHVVAYALAVVFVNPPWLPAKLGFVLSRTHRKVLWPFWVHVGLFVALFSTAVSVIGSNHWRYTLDYALPFAMVVAPIVEQAWTRRRAALLVACGVEFAVGALVPTFPGSPAPPLSFFGCVR